MELNQVIKQAKDLFNSETLIQFILFGIVGTTGVMVNTGMLWALTAVFGIHYLIAAAIATETAIISNFLGNHHLTFKDTKNTISFPTKFWRFQLVSVFTLILTLAILWALVTSFGKELLLVWNLVAIVITFVANFLLNKKFTWPSMKKVAAIAIAALAIPAMVHADLAATSQLGYHPEGFKQVVVYTDEDNGGFVIKEGGSIIYSGDLSPPSDHAGSTVKCQGSLSCLVGDFSDFQEPGEYVIETTMGVSTRSFTIDSSIYSQNVDILLEFFDAQQQQGSSYHADMHQSHSPAFTIMADGSFIMEADQASITLSRLGSAYRANPSMFSDDLREQILLYAEYLKGLQGISVEDSSPGNGGFRMDYTIRINNAFTPLPGSADEIEVYVDKSGTPHPDSPVEVVVLCSNGDPQCLAFAESAYKCQNDEICLNRSYVGRIGTITSHNDGYGVMKGWNYDFGCFPDMDLSGVQFSDAPNPCMVFSTEEDIDFTIRALLGYLEALPAINDLSPGKAAEFYERSLSTYEYAKPHVTQGSDAASWGAALFLLYDYSGDPAYLQEAHALGENIDTAFNSYLTDGREFYWEEYVRHEQDILDNGLSYEVDGTDPREFFRGKMYHDYKDLGDQSISANGERVYTVFKDTRFSNSRPILIEGLLASKAAEFNPAEEFIPQVADAQLAWLTGMNGVQDGVSTSDRANIVSYSFIFGIGEDQPSEFHSRYLLDTGHKKRTNGELLGAYGTDLFFKTSEGYEHFDGTTEILGQRFGSLGNGHEGEEKIDPWTTEQQFLNGKTHISGWINGPFDIQEDPDTIFNYDDTIQTYEFTETTNEMVATAVELFAHVDARKNGLPRHQGVRFDGPSHGNNDTDENPDNTTGNETGSGGILIQTIPAGASISLDGTSVGQTNTTGGLFIPAIAEGNHTVFAGKDGYENASRTITVQAETNASVTFSLANISNGTDTNDTFRFSIIVWSDPEESDVGLNGTYVGTTDEEGYFQTGNLTRGSYAVVVGKQGYAAFMDTISPQDEENTVVVNATLQPQGNSTGNTSITGTSTNVTDGRMYETETAAFTINLDQPRNITWTIDGRTERSSFGSEDTFVWTPGPLFTSNSADVIITAQVPGDSAVWPVTIDYVVNPFFSSPDGGGDIVGAKDAMVRLFTNDNAHVFTEVNVTVQSKPHDTVNTATHRMDPILNEGSNETDWRKILTDMDYGNSYIVSARGYNNATGESATFHFGTARAHYREFPSDERRDDDDDNDNRRSSSGGGGASSPTPELVYAIFVEDVVMLNESQTLRMDARVDVGGEITDLDATIITPGKAKKDISLELVQGTNTYGTWEAEISRLITGKYLLDSVTIWTEDTPTQLNVSDVSFYAVSESVGADENLQVVYSVLNSSRVTNGSLVKFTLDARDSVGITEINATVESSRGTTNITHLTLAGGSATYGTWEAVIEARTPDTTYTISEVTLSNGEESIAVPLKSRKFYVEALPVAPGNLLTGNAVQNAPLLSWTRLSELAKEPLIPTIIGFLLMILLMTTILLKEKYSGHLE